MTVVIGLADPAPEVSRAAARPQPPASGVPRLSVVVPTFHRPELLMSCLRALMAQDIGPHAFEVVVVDDGHDDLVRALVDALAQEPGAPALRYLRPTLGRGPAVARNLGWRAAGGAIVAFTDDDTLPQRNWLSAGEAALCSGPWVALGGRVVVPLPAGVAPTDHQKMTLGLERTEFVTANCFVRRQALHQVQGFDERFTRAWREDTDLQFCLQDVAGPVGRCEEAVVLHPARTERWGVSLRQQKNAYFEALLFAKHPQRYFTQLGLPVPWDYYAIVALTLLTLWLALADVPGSALVSGAFALAGVLRLALRRLRGTSHRPGHVIEMLATSALIPFLSVYWRLRGGLHFRVWFL
jgi:glycosyltransferase involved in cell wall biosynthesis